MATLAATGARADDAPSVTQRPQDGTAGANAARAVGAPAVEGPTILDSIPALHPIDAVRDSLRDRYGIYFRGKYTGDPYADVSGGMRRGATYAGRLDVRLDVDAAKLAGIDGGTLHANMYQIHGRDISKDFVGNLLSSNDIAGRPTTRLYELWYEQKLGDKVSVRAGQQGSDVELLTSDYAASFIDSSFGWPGLLATDLPQGGPAYPLATPAVRVKVEATDSLSVLAAVFDGDPAGPGPGDPQARDPYGLNFRVSDPPLAFLESQYHYNRGAVTGLPGTLKLGAFAHFGRFADQAIGTDGLPLALGNGMPIEHSPDAGLYGILDQQIYRKPGDDPKNGIGVFVRAIGAPGDRNPVDLYLDAGFSALGLVPGRPDDQFGVAAAFARISPAAQAADVATDIATGLPAPVRSFEAVIEATYQAQVMPGLVLQPTVQYVIHPGGGIADPYGNGLTPIRNALVLGVTTAVRF